MSYIFVWILNNLPKDVTYSTQNSVASSSTQFFTQTNVGSQFNSDEIFIKQTRIVTLGDMKKLKVVWSCCFCLIWASARNDICLTNYAIACRTLTVLRLSQPIRSRSQTKDDFFYRCTECSCKAEGNEPLFVRKKGTRPMNLSSSMSPLQLYVFSFTLIPHKV
jgi:hypothetical protein